MATNCDCMDRFNKLCRLKTGDAKGYIDWIGRPNEPDGTEYPKIRFIYSSSKHLRPDRMDVEDIIPSYCPFCGEEYTLGGRNDAKSPDDN